MKISAEFGECPRVAEHGNRASRRTYCKDVGAQIVSFRSSIAHPPIPLFTLRRAPHGTERKTRGAYRYSLTRKSFAFSASCRLSRRTVESRFFNS
jgi:hypothetical protein